MPSLKRFEHRAGRPLHRETFISEWPAAGLCVAGSPDDPVPSLTLHEGRVVEMDGRPEADFDLLDRFIASHALDLAAAEIAMPMDPVELARRVVDIQVSRQEVAFLASGCTPAKLVAIVQQLNVVEMMMGMQKMRLRRTPANQAHVTNRKENPALLAADAAEAALRGFAEEETTVGGASRYAPLNALAVLIGSQVGRPGVLTQCAVEEALGLNLALKGLTSYAETLSVYGTADAFVDGDDTPWSKALLASAYASRGVKVRFTSGTGSEALMGHAGGQSMLYLEARSLLIVKGAGSQGVQNGSISLIALPMALPRGLWAVLAENLLASLLGLEVASGNDALSSHSDIRKGAKLMLQFLPGTDFVTSGYSVMPKADNLFGGGNFDADDLDDWYALQRDMAADGGIHPVSEEAVAAIRERAARSIQAVFAELGLPGIGDEEVERAITAYDSDDLPDRDQAADVAAGERLLTSDASVVDVIRALARRGYRELAEDLLEMQRQRVAGDYLQPAAIFGAGIRVHSALNDPNGYAGPGTGYRLPGEPRWDMVQQVTGLHDPRLLVPQEAAASLFSERGPAEAGRGVEVVLGIGPAFGAQLRQTIAGLAHQDVIHAIQQGCADVGVPIRIVRILDTSDCAFIGHRAACLSGSRIGIGLQSKGTTVIHRSDLAPLDNLELFSMAPSLSLATYRAIGRNAATYALGQVPAPIPVSIDNTARLRLIVLATLLHEVETKAMRRDGRPVEVELHGSE
jgi:propanediol dehydratase large subunit